MAVVSILKRRETEIPLRSRLIPIALSQCVGIACGVVGIKVVSTLIPPAALGAYGVFLTFSTIGMWLIHAGVLRYLSRNWASAPNRSQLLRVTSRAWARKLPWLFAGAVGGAWVMKHAGASETATIFVALGFSASLLSLSALAQTALQVGREHWKDFGVSASGSLSRTFAPPLLYALTGASAGLYAGFCVHALVIVTAGLWSLRAYWRADAPNVSPDGSIEKIYDGPFFIVLASANWLLTGLGRWIAALFYGEVTAGHFTLGSSIALIVPAVVGAIFLQIFQPAFFAIADGDKPEANRVLARQVDRVVLGLCGSVVVGLLALHFVAPKLIGVLIDERYREALPWIVPCGLFGLTTIALQFYHVMMIAARKETACAYVELISASVLLAGSVGCATLSQAAFAVWLSLTPLTVLVITRSIARFHLLRAEPLK